MYYLLSRATFRISIQVTKASTKQTPFYQNKHRPLTPSHFFSNTLKFLIKYSLNMQENLQYNYFYQEITPGPCWKNRYNEREREKGETPSPRSRSSHFFTSSGPPAISWLWGQCGRCFQHKWRKKDTRMISSNVWVEATHQPKVNESWSICNLIKPGVSGNSRFPWFPGIQASNFPSLPFPSHGIL